MIYNTYVIIPTNEITDEMVQQSINEDTTIRYNFDGTKAVLKFGSKFPSTVQGYAKYTHEEILEQLSDPEWS